MKKVDLSDLKVGDKVFTMHNGWDTISEIRGGWWGMYWLSSGHIYSRDGQRYEKDTHPTIFHSQQEFREYWGLESNTLTKREQFAMAAMQGILSNSKAPEFDYDHVTSAAVRFSDYLVYNLENIDVETP
jgi:hypothetical protein